MKPEPNTNLIAPRTILPTLKAHLAPRRHVLCCVAYGLPDAQQKAVHQIPQALMQELKDMEEKYI